MADEDRVPLSPRVCPKCKSYSYWRESEEPVETDAVRTPIKVVPSAPPIFPPPAPAIAYAPSSIPDTVIGMTPPPIAYGLSTSPPRPDPVVESVPLREQISYRLASRREEPQPEGFVGQPQPQPQPEVRPEVAPPARESSVEGVQGDSNWAEKELERLDELERIALEAINGSNRPTNQ